MEWHHDGIRVTDDPAAVDLDLGRRLAALAIAHPDVAACRRLLLATRDAHGVYTPLGFAPVPEPENLLGISRDTAELYGR